MPRKHCSPREVANEVSSLLERAGGRLRFSIIPAQAPDRGGDLPDRQKQPRRRSAQRRGKSITSVRNA